MKSFMTRLLSLVTILAAIFIYQAVGTVRNKNEQILQMQAEAAETQNRLDSDETKLEALAADAGSTSSAAVSTDTAGSGQYKDGTYEGEAEGYGGPIDLTVTVSGGRITDITVLSHDGEDDAFFGNAVSIIDTIISAQSADVDTVSGATFSSTGIKNAVADALSQAQ